LVAADEIRPYVTEAVLAEYYQVFEYGRLKHLSRVRIARLRGLLEKTATKVKTGGRVKNSGHEADNRIYACAVASKAAYIITENIKHFKQPYKTTRILTARQLLKLLKTGWA
jgi:predicted nucleic acid-binding protein